MPAVSFSPLPIQRQTGLFFSCHSIIWCCEFNAEGIWQRLRKPLVPEEDTVRTSPSSCRTSKNYFALSSHSQKVTVLHCEIPSIDVLKYFLIRRFLSRLLMTRKLKLKYCKQKKLIHLSPQLKPKNHSPSDCFHFNSSTPDCFHFDSSTPYRNQREL